jgi:cephalosporin hydroxylase
MILRPIARIFTPEKPFADPVRNDGATFLEVDNWIISRFVVERLIPLVGFHPFPLNELTLLTAAVCRIRPTHILEWGTNIGVSARIFHEICTAFHLDSEIHSIDLPDHEQHEEHPGKERGRLVRGISQVQLHQGDGIEVALSILARETSPVRPLFFLDGDHRYESVSRELHSIIALASAASILVHDTFHQSAASGYNTGPYRAVQDVLRETGALFQVTAQELGLPGMTLLWKRT